MTKKELFKQQLSSHFIQPTTSRETRQLVYFLIEHEYLENEYGTSVSKDEYAITILRDFTLETNRGDILNMIKGLTLRLKSDNVSKYFLKKYKCNGKFYD